MAGFMIIPTPILVACPPRMIVAPPPPPLSPPFPIHHISLPDSYCIPFYDHILQVTVTKEAAHVHQWISTVCRLHQQSPDRKIIVGLDTEWRPNTAPGDENPIAVLQLSVGCHCLVFQILQADLLPRSLHHFLADPRHIFCGIGIEDDIKKLYEHHGLYVGRTADLNDLLKLAVEEYQSDQSEYRYLGLKKMAQKVLGKEMKKPFHVTMSDWDNEELDADQVEYAAIDSFVSFDLAFRLFSSIGF